MNAGTKDNEVNVVMDRTKAWTDDSDICWIPMKAGAQGVKTGQRLLWRYDPWSSRGARTASCRRPASGASRFPPDVPAGWFAGWSTLSLL